MTKWTTLARLKDDMWEESRQYGLSELLSMAVIQHLKSCLKEFQNEARNLRV